MSEQLRPPKQRAAKPAEPIRIAPVRRTTITPDAWGFRSVPGVLSDFQRHTSQSVPNSADSDGSLDAPYAVLPTAHHANAHSAHSAHGAHAAHGTHAAGAGAADRVASLLSFVALPTALAALGHAVADEPLAAGLVAGGAVAVATACTALPLRRVVPGVFGVVLASLLVETRPRPLGAGVAYDGVALFASLLVVPLPASLTGWPRSVWQAWPQAWLLGVLLFAAYIGGSWLLLPLLAGAMWARLAAPASSSSSSGSGSRRRWQGYALGAALAGSTLIVSAFTGRLSTHIATTALIACASIGVFFVLADGVVVPSRLNVLATMVLGLGVEGIVQSRVDAMQVIELLAVVPSLWLSPSGLDLSFGGSARGGRGGVGGDLDATNSDEEDFSVANTSAERSMPGTVLDSILAHDDTRSIFYFFLLNFSFMLVQLLYSVLSHSLGLLSDSIHMFFDCLALLVGLLASILAKFPPSSRFPFGLAMVETVSGFANGCLLLVISVGVLFEAMERVSNPVELEKVTELIVVSVLGLLVNMVGIFAFNHGHSHGHGHSHDHGHSHGHSHEHSHGTEHTHSHSTHEKAHNEPSEATSENLHGILLHIVADTMGSVGVIVSTLLLKYTGWAGWDAVASIVISVLIFVSAVPLVRSSAKSLLLGLREAEEHRMRDLLSALYYTEGVASYSVPKFWDAGSGVRGVIHVQHRAESDANVVREKVRRVLVNGGVKQFVIQMEAEGTPCWCQKHTLL